MQISVALTPSLLREPRTHAVAVVDVLRLTTSLGAMFENGLLRALISDSARDARQLAARNFSLLCGEAKSVPVAGFDYGNSPSEFAGLSFKGKSAVLWTTNGTKALGVAAQSPVVLSASLRNRGAVAQKLLSEATRRRIDIAVVCAGTERGSAFSLEDTAAAGAVVEAALEGDPALHLTDSAWGAYHLWRFYRGDMKRAFRHAAHARALVDLGFADDLAYASEVDVSTVVPRLYVEGDVKTMRVRR